jgi:hypothetical protein
VEQAARIVELEAVESPRQGKCVEWERILRLEDDEDEILEQAVNGPKGIIGDVSSWQHYDSGHLAGTSRRAFEARRETKSRQENTEEEIVLEYIKKQSLVEEQHRSNGKSCVVASLDQEDEDMRRALKLSMQGDDCTREVHASIDV